MIFYSIELLLRCLDMESLCVVSDEKVWCIRLDVQILSHCGNVADAASVAGLAALCHFRGAIQSGVQPRVTIMSPNDSAVQYVIDTA